MAKYRIDWFVNSFDNDTHMGYDDIDANSFDDAQLYADEHCDGFEYVITEMEDDTMMTKTRFIDEVVAEVRRTFSGFEVSVADIAKPNVGVLTGIQMKPEGSEVCPVFYVDDIYDEYRKGGNYENLVDDLISAIEDWVCSYGEMPKNKFEIDFDFDSIKDKLQIRVMSFERNMDYLDTVPHVHVGNDLAVVFVITVGSDNNGLFQCVITDDLAEKNGYNTDNLFKAAMENSNNIDPARLFGMSYAIFGNGANLLDYPDAKTDEDSVLVLTTNSGINGASAILYPSVQERIAEVVGGAYYVLPTSVHEVMIIPAGETDADKLKQILMDGNGTITQEKDVLSNNIYKFDDSENITTEHFFIAA